MNRSDSTSGVRPSNILHSLQNQVESLVEDHVLLLQLKGTKKIAQVIALVAAVLLLVFLGFCVLLALSVIGGYYLVKSTGNFYIGAGIIAGVYLLLFITLMIIRKKYFQTSVANTIIKLLFDATEKNEDHAE